MKLLKGAGWVTVLRCLSDAYQSGTIHCMGHLIQDGTASLPLSLTLSLPPSLSISLSPAPLYLFMYLTPTSLYLPFCLFDSIALWLSVCYVKVHLL